MINLKRNGSKYLSQKFIKAELNGEDFRAWTTLTGLKTSEVSFSNLRYHRGIYIDLVPP